MKQLVMKVKHFFNINHRKDGTTITILGGSLNCDLHQGEVVEIHTVNDILKTAVEVIKCYKDELDFALSGLSCGLGFSGISHMQFRVEEPIVNPHDPKTNLVEFLKWDGHLNDAQGVYIFKEIPDHPNKVPALKEDFEDYVKRYNPHENDVNKIFREWMFERLSKLSTEPKTKLFKVVKAGDKVFVKMLTCNERVWSGAQWEYRYVRKDSYPTTDEKYATDFKSVEEAEGWIRERRIT